MNHRTHLQLTDRYLYDEQFREQMQRDQSRGSDRVGGSPHGSRGGKRVPGLSETSSSVGAPTITTSAPPRSDGSCV
jgi:hypothetical protein